jgi:hypothetical protein
MLSKIQTDELVFTSHIKEPIRQDGASPTRIDEARNLPAGHLL